MAAENEVQIHCTACSTRYRLDPANLWDGRMVRCAACKHTWYQLPPVDGVLPAPLDAPPEPPAATAAPQQVYERPEWMNEEDENKDELTFKPSNKGQYFLEEDMRVLPEAVVPAPPSPKKIDVPAEALIHKPMGMGAFQYGVFTFLLLMFLTASGLMLARDAIVRNYPPMLSLYNAAHIPVDAPAEGLILSQMLAENLVDKGARTLTVQAKAMNTLSKPMPYPYFTLTAKGPDAAVLAEKTFHEDSRVIAAGGDLTLKFTLPAAPDDVKTAELVVTRE